MHVFSEQLSRLAPSDCPHLILQAVAGPMAAATASTLTNPMDVVRARVQVKNRLHHKLLQTVTLYSAIKTRVEHVLMM